MGLEFSETHRRGLLFIFYYDYFIEYCPADKHIYIQNSTSNLQQYICIFKISFNFPVLVIDAMFSQILFCVEFLSCNLSMLAGDELRFQLITPSSSVISGAKEYLNNLVP